MQRPDKILAHTRILVVEDEPACRGAMCLFLETAGATVIPKSSAEEAVEILGTEDLDAVITDIRLEGMDGISLLKHIREKGIEIPVIVITAYASLQSAISALQLGADDYLIKPVTRADILSRAVQAAIRNHFLRCQNALLKARLEESDLSFRTVFNNISDMVFAFTLDPDLNPCCFEQANEAAVRILDYTPGALHRMTILDITAATHRRELLARLSSKAAETGSIMDTVLIRADGSRLAAEISCHAVELNSKTIVIAIVRDATVQVQAAAGLAHMIEQERQSIGRELHDVVCQDLASISILSGTLLKQRHDPDISAIDSAAHSALESARRLARGMLPAFDDSSDLEAALNHLMESFKKKHSITYSIRIEHPVAVKAGDGLLHLFRIIQEAASNSVKHGRAGHIDISVSRSEDMCILSIDDNGTGIVESSGKTGSMGLIVMRQRSRIIGGSLSVRNKTGGGTRVEVRWQETENA